MRWLPLLLLITGCLEIGDPMYRALPLEQPPPPEIQLVWTAPADGVALPPRDPVVLVFDRALEAGSARVTLTAAGSPVPTVNATYYRGMLELLPPGGFAASTEHELTLDAVSGADGSSLAEPITVRFTTSASATDTPGYAQIQAILTGACALSGCHEGASSPHGADYSAGVSYGNMVGVASGCGDAACDFACLGACTQGEKLQRVNAGRPCQSCMMAWLRGDDPVMPPALRGETERLVLPAADIDRIERWILGGAPQ